MSGYRMDPNLGWINLNDVEIPDYFAPSRPIHSSSTITKLRQRTTSNPSARRYDDGTSVISTKRSNDNRPVRRARLSTSISDASSVGTLTGTASSARVVDTKASAAPGGRLRHRLHQPRNRALQPRPSTSNGFDIDEEFAFGTRPNSYPSLQLNAAQLHDHSRGRCCVQLHLRRVRGQYATAVHRPPRRLVSSACPRSTSPQRHSTISNAPYAYSQATPAGFHFAPANRNTGVIVHAPTYDLNRLRLRRKSMAGSSSASDSRATAARHRNTGTDHGVNHDNCELYGPTTRAGKSDGSTSAGRQSKRIPAAPQVDLLRPTSPANCMGGQRRLDQPRHG